MKLPAGEYFLTPTQAVAVQPRAPQARFPLHDHEFDELVIVRSGHGWHVLDEEPRLITCGEVLYMRAEDRHAFEEVHDLYLTNVLYRPTERLLRPDRLRACMDPVDGTSGARRHWQVCEETLDRLTPLLGRLASEASRNDPLSEVMAESLFMEVCVTLARERFAPDGEGVPCDARLTHVLAYLRAHCTGEVDLDDAARRFGYSTRNFARVFREATATTPHNYLVQLRLGHAMRALRTTEKSVTEIAFDSGFNDSCHFSSSFSKMTGVSPREYRRRARAPGATAAAMS